MGNWSLIPGLERSPGEGNENCLQYSCLENPMNGGAWQATIHGVVKSKTPTVKGFSIVSETEIDVFLIFPCFVYDPTDVGNLISGSSAFSKSCLYIWNFSVHILLKPKLKDFDVTLQACEMNSTVG